MDSIGIFFVVPLFIPFNETLLDNSFSNILVSVINKIPVADKFLTTIILVLTIFIIKSLVLYYIQSVIIKVKNKINYKLKMGLIDETENITYNYYLNQSASKFVEIINNQIQRVLEGFTNYLGSITQSISFLFYLFILFAINPAATFAIVIYGSILTIIYKIIGVSLRKKSLDQSTTSISFLHNFNELLKAFKYLKATSQVKKFVQNLIKNEVRNLLDITIKLEDLTARVSALKELIMIIGLIIVLIIERNLESREMSLITFLIFLVRGFTALSSAQNNFQNVNACYGAIKIYSETKEAFENNREINGTLSIKNIKSMVFNNVSFSYGNKSILSKLNFQINPNDRIGLIGESGSGKSTLINLICGIQNPTIGEILVNGINRNNINIKEFRTKIGYVGQETVIFSKSLYYNLFLEEYQIDRYLTRKKEILNILKKLGLKDFIPDLDETINQTLGDSGSKLSGGQRQRLTFARELLRNPQILFLDEITSALDFESKKIISKTIRELINVIIIQITHDHRLIEDYDKVYKIENGKLLNVKGSLKPETFKTEV